MIFCFLVCSVLTRITVGDGRQRSSLTPSAVRQVWVKGAAGGQRNKEERGGKGDRFSTRFLIFTDGIDEM